MKRLQLLFALVILAATSISTSAQQSCSFIIHVDNTNGTDDIACGGEGTPCATISHGIQRAVTENYSDVRIATGTGYNEIVEIVGGVNLWGGFDSQWVYSGVSSITGGLAGNGEFYTVRADGITVSTTLSDLEIIAPNASTPGKSSTGLHMTSSTGIICQRVIFRGGSGAAGSNGANGVSSTVVGVAGANGGNANEFNTACNDDDSGAGGAGGVVSGYPSTAGGNGGRGGFMDSNCSGFPNLNATSGVSGANATLYLTSGYGYRGSGGGTCNPGGHANNGQTVHGTGGSGAAASANIVGQFWSATFGVDGTIGQHGTGGGGGGGSGGCDDGTDSYGAGGGGGGSGGLAASTVGGGGMSGGNSAAVFMLSSTTSFVSCDFFLGTAGNGGNGGNSASGAAGGLGGNGGAADGDSDAGGNGGNGGAGGNSGAGGGGSSGSVYGIFANNSTINHDGLNYIGGTSGTPGNPGTATVSGTAGTIGTLGTINNTGGNPTLNATPIALEEDPCIEITTADLSTLQFCAGEMSTVDYNAIGNFSGSNTFTAQLSDATGDFSSPTDIGSVVSNLSGTINIQFPVSLATGTAYRIRVISSATPSVGIQNPTDIIINALPAVIANATSADVCAGSQVTLTGSGADSFTWNNNVSDGVAFIPTLSMYYTVIGTDAATLCANTDSVLVTVVDLPDTSVVVNGNQLAAVLAGASYQWVDCDNNFAPITNAIAQTFIASSAGNYAVVVTQNGCSDTSSCYNIMTVGLENTAEKDAVLLLYPNPSSGMFQLISNAEKPMEVTIFNLMGQTVYSEANVTNNTVFDLTRFENGLYSVRFSNKELNVVRQVIILK